MSRLELFVQDGGGGASAILDRQGHTIPSHEHDERLARIRAGLLDVPEVSVAPASELVSESRTHAVLERTHRPAYLDLLRRRSEQLPPGAQAFEQGCSAPGVDADTPLVAGIWQLACAGARTALSAARACLRGAPMAYAVCRPPGHHAGPDWLGGYCYLNNAAACVRLLREGGAGRVGVVDFDFHFGNGTAALLRDDEGAFYGSSHCATEIGYPYVVTDAANDRQVLQAYAEPPDPARFLDGLTRILTDCRQFGVEVLVVSVGFDILDGDPHGGWHLPPSILGDVGTLLARTALPLCLVQEGGYALPQLRTAARNLAAALTSRQMS